MPRTSSSGLVNTLSNWSMTEDVVEVRRRWVRGSGPSPSRRRSQGRSGLVPGWWRRERGRAVPGGDPHTVVVDGRRTRRRNTLGPGQARTEQRRLAQSRTPGDDDHARPPRRRRPPVRIVAASSAMRSSRPKYTSASASVQRGQARERPQIRRRLHRRRIVGVVGGRPQLLPVGNRQHAGLAGAEGAVVSHTQQRFDGREFARQVPAVAPVTDALQAKRYPRRRGGPDDAAARNVGLPAGRTAGQVPHRTPPP